MPTITELEARLNAQRDVLKGLLQSLRPTSTTDAISASAATINLVRKQPPSPEKDAYLAEAKALRGIE
ncbi:MULTISPECIES: hypothetical protein [Xanthomonas]|uniref:Uncharacterized protein n=1 Tax=Xanthomonas euvesicatoria TaxID=456327 RepID=A0AAW3U0C8_XANEU|nr:MULTISPECIES: hypothetical protein [Xanthomonas]MBB4722663.1 hypothetical protein [Xanthomonas euvesicatoria]MBB4869256.1 hypothetical protein [Xanthomonas euvesicatoria]OOX20971.1 hypothetical protein Xbuh_06005 [Xanthomonas axonopodis pv. bauhiniae]